MVRRGLSGLVVVVVCAALGGCGGTGSSPTGSSSTTGLSKSILETKKGHLVKSCAQLYARFKAERQRDSGRYLKKSEFSCIR
jgi:hypothetical protein